MEDFFIELVMYNYKILCTFFIKIHKENVW